MESFLFYLGKVAIAAGAFYLAYLVLFQNQKHFEFNRIYLPVSMLLSFLIPVITFTTIKYVELTTPESTAPTFSFAPSTPVEYVAPAFKFQWVHYLFGLYLLGVVSFLLHLLAGHLKAMQIIRTSKIQQVLNQLINITRKDIHPFSFFNKIVLSEKTLASPDLEMIVTHEKIHVHEKHTFDILFTEVMYMFQWFNPFAWLIKDAVRNNLEYKTDNEIAKIYNPQKYQLAMVALADKKEVAPFLTALNGSQLKNRIIMMKKKTENKFKVVKQLVVLPLLAILVMGLSNKEVKTEFIQQDTNYNTQKTIALNNVLPDNAIIHEVKSKNLIHGKVIDGITLNPVSNADIVLEGMVNKTTTNENGDYQIEFGKNESPVVVDVSANGYYTNKVVYYGTNENIDVHLTKILTKKSGDEVKVEVIVDGKVIPSDDGKLSQVDFSKGINSMDVINALNINNVVANGLNLALEVPTLYIRTSDYITGTNLDFEENTNTDIPLDKKNSTEKFYYAIDNKIVSKEEYLEKGKQGFENVVILSGNSATSKYGDEFKNVVDAKTGVPNFRIKNAEEIHLDESIDNGIKNNSNSNHEQKSGKTITGKVTDDQSENTSDLNNIQQTKIIRGKVTDKAGNPLVQVNVIQYDKPGGIAISGTVTDNKGVFIVEFESNHETLYFSKKGYKSKEVNVKGKDTINVVLEKDSNISNGQSGLSFSIGQIGVAFPAQNMKTTSSSKEGANIQITQADGSGDKPLIIVDGVIFVASFDEDFDFATADIEDFGKLINVAPEYIESIEVLKDANSIAQYGDKAKNGVLLIKTKKTGEAINSILELRNFIVREIIFPKEAQAGINSSMNLSLYVRFNKDGKLHEITDSPKNSDDILSLDEVIVTALRDNNGSGTSAKEVENLIAKEASRVIEKLPIIKISQFNGKVVKFNFKFILQD